jgi:integrase
MSRPNKVWFRKDIGWWMVTLDGKKIRLAEGKTNRKLAEQKFHELKVVQARSAENCNARIADIIDGFLTWSKVHRSPETCRNHLWYGQKFSEHIGYLKATELRPNHLTQWVDSHAWGQTTQRNARRSVYRAFAWAVEEGLLTSNPLAGMKCPAALTRQRAMTDAEFRSLLRGSRHDFKVLLFALMMSGCRPKEATSLTWNQVHQDRWVLPQHKTFHKTHKPRVIYLTKPLQRLMTVLRRRGDQRGAANAHVFLNAYGRPWTRNAIRLRIERLKRKLHLADDLCCYMTRHAFGTAAVLNGVDVMTVAQLMGHTSLEMIQRVYVHLADKHDHLNQAAERATRPLAAPKPSPAEPNQAG